MRKIIVAIAFAGLLASIGADTARADSDTSAKTAKSSPADCRKDGWQILRRAEDGTRFASRAECVRYAARGGEVSQPIVNLSYVISDFTFMGRILCHPRVDVSGFAPNTQYAVSVAPADGSAPPDPVEFSVTTDASGAAVGVSPDVYEYQPQGELTRAIVDGVLSSSVPVSCLPT